MTAVIVSVLTLGVNGRIDGVSELIGGVNMRVDSVDARLGRLELNVGAIDGKFGTLNTTLLFLTTCIVDLEGPLPVVRDDDGCDDGWRCSRAEHAAPSGGQASGSCRTAHTRALQATR